MIKVLIVDDEPFFREFLRTVWNWEAYGFVICGEAKSGIEALQIAKQTSPELALVDIDMPLMDGLLLSEELKKRFPDIAIVMVSAHGQFEYARKALKIGVEDYLLKPFDSDELYLTLSKIKTRLQKLREFRNSNNNHSHWLRELFFNMLISQDQTLSDEEIIKQFDRFGISNESDYFGVVTVEIDRLYERWSDNREILLWKNTISNILNEIISKHERNFVFFGPEDRVISLIQFRANPDGVVSDLINFQYLCDMVKRHFKFTATIGIGKPNRGFKGIRESYMETLVALQSKITVGNDRVIHYLESDRMFQGFYSNEINEKMMLAMRLNDSLEINKLLDEVFDYIREKRLNVDMTYVIILGLVSLCLSHIIDSGQEIVNVLGENFSPYQEITRQENLERTHDWLADIFDKSIRLNDDLLRTSRSRQIFEEAKSLIDQNYQYPDLTVEGITKLLFMNGSYLRRVFSKEGNMSISDYITHVRMQQAKELIQLKAAKISIISNMVGYSDPGYFSKCFKKYYGVTPSQYLQIYE